MAQSHQIEIQGLFKWINDEQNRKVLFASSSNDKKALYATLNGGYEVHHEGHKVWEGIQPAIAVEEYNKI